MMKQMYRIQAKKRDISSFSLKKSLFILAIFCFLLFSSGCTDSNDSGNESEIVKNTQVDDSGNKAGLIEVTKLSQIDEALDNGPVVLKLGSKECIPCKEQEQILSELLPTYRGSASMMLIDVNEYTDLAMTFEVINIPDTCIIVGKEDENYIYVKPDGGETSDRMSARFIGVADKKDLSKTLDKAIESWKAKE